LKRQFIYNSYHFILIYPAKFTHLSYQKMSCFNENHKIIISVIIVFVILLGFGISEVVIYTKGIKFGSSPCSQFPSNLTYYTATKDILSQWHWRYEFDQFLGSIYQKCPTLTHDARIEIGGTLVAGSDGKVFTVVSQNYILDCTGNKIFQTRTGSAFNTIINQNQIVVSFEVMDMSDNVIAYVGGTHFFTDIIVLNDIYGNVIAQLYRNTVSIKWVWEFTIYNVSHPATDPRLLTLMAGKKSFSDDDDKTDICNSYFWGVVWFFVAVACVIFLVGIACLCLFFDAHCSDSKSGGYQYSA